MSTLADRAQHQVMKAMLRAPEPLSRRLFGEPPRNDRGAPLDRQVHVLLELIDRTDQPDLHDLGPAAARALYNETTRAMDLPPVEVARVEEIAIPVDHGELAARVYTPSLDRQSNGQAPPALVFYHGGGFVVGCAAGYDGICRWVADRAGCVVVNVDYRLAPEHCFPAAVDDCAAAYRWVRANADELGVDPERIAVGGDSAGGNLATVVCQEQIRAGEPTPAFQLLIYPATDYDVPHPSYDHFAEGFFLSLDLIEWFARCYYDDRPKSGEAGYEKEPRIAPVVFDRLDQMPPAMLVTAGFDPLRDEGEHYVRLLREAGVPVMHRPFDTLVHGFWTMGGVIDEAARAIDDIVEEFRVAMRRL